MRIPRIHVATSLAANSDLTLGADSAHYLKRVLRLNVDAPVVLFNGTPLEYPGTLIELSSRSALVRTGDGRDPGTESPLQTWLVQGLCRGQRMDFCVQKATELGVNRIVPLQTERSVVRLKGDKAKRRVEHWRAVATSACEQSGRTQVPVIDLPQTLNEFLAGDIAATLVVMDPVGDSAERWQAPAGPLALLVGPEGGWSDDERNRIVAAGAATWRVGPRVFRTETAGVVALALAQHRWGDLA